VLTLRERELEFDVQALRDGDALNRQQLPRALLADHDPLIHHLLSGKCGATTRISPSSSSSSASRLRETCSTIGVLDVYSPLTNSCETSSVGYEFTNAATFRLEAVSVYTANTKFSRNVHLLGIHLEKLAALSVLHLHDVINRGDTGVIATLGNL
jgi:hypothetical protein